MYTQIRNYATEECLKKHFPHENATLLIMTQFAQQTRV